MPRNLWRKQYVDVKISFSQSAFSVSFSTSTYLFSKCTELIFIKLCMHELQQVSKYGYIPFAVAEKRYRKGTKLFSLWNSNSISQFFSISLTQTCQNTSLTLAQTRGLMPMWVWGFSHEWLCLPIIWLLTQISFSLFLFSVLPGSSCHTFYSPQIWMCSCKLFFCEK